MLIGEKTDERNGRHSLTNSSRSWWDEYAVTEIHLTLAM